MTARPPRAWVVGAAVVAAACLLVALPWLPGRDRAGAADQPWSVTVTPTEQLGDGQLVTVTVRTTPAHQVNNVQIQLCRAGVEYQSAKGPDPHADFTYGGANCPNKPISSSADAQVVDSTAVANAPTDKGSVSKYRVGVGAIEWVDVIDRTTKHTLSCGPEQPCALVVEVRHGEGPLQWTPVVVPLQFKLEDPIEGCGGPAPGVLLSSGSDRMKDAWISWTLDECHQDGRQGGASRGVWNGEGNAVKAFAKGDVDIAYTAAGYGNEVGLLEEPPASPRQAVAVPVAINAAVLAVAGGHPNETGVKVPYEDLRLTREEVATLLSAGPSGMQPIYNQIFARNPELQENFFDTVAGVSVGAPAEAATESWIFTEQLRASVPDEWVVPDVPLFGDDAGRSRGAHASMALADPSFAQSLTTLSGRPPLANAIGKLVLSRQTQGGMWVLTDLETATALGMTPVKIANDEGEFVPITPETITAGVATMDETDNGLLLPDPHAVDEIDGVTPYPMAMVEYALVPAEPLVTDTCTARVDSQARLVDWLEYITGPGQQALPPGMVPLTPELRQRAASAIDQMGGAEVSGKCAGKVVTPATSTTTTTAPAQTSGGTDGGDTSGSTSGGTTGSGSRPRSGGGAATTTTPTTVSSVVDTSTGQVELVSMPAYAGRRAAGWAGVVVALVGVTALSGLAALLASGRSPLQLLHGPRRRRPDPS